ncbi:MAG: eukaryotic-like serine/threonine-protein kinase [Verrucomicrobiota bacterium]|jgi:serine/threonine protein kinase
MDELDLGQTIRGFSAGQKILNRYTFVRILGRGGMGVVWLARDDELERQVALKFLPELVVHDRAVLEELKHETRRSLALTHHNIVRIYDFAQDGDCACISMEYVDGATLSSLRVDRPDKVFEVEELGPLLQQVCDALQYAHAQARIVHRDLKPSNLMVNAKGDVKVADFGIARSLTDSVSMLTMARGTSGTLVYMSPQQLDGEHVSELDDIYTLGATIYELLTGKPPFYSGQIDRLVREKIPPTMAKRRADLAVTSRAVLPQHWEETIAACLAKDPAARPRSALELKERLLAPAHVSPASASTAVTAAAAPTKVSRIRQHPLIAACVVGAIPFLVVGIVWFVDRSTPQKESPAVQPQVTPAPSIVPHNSPTPSSPVASATPSTPTPTAAPSTSAPVYHPPVYTAPVYNPPPLPPPNTSTTATEQIKQFVAEHLRKTERCDCEGVLLDYASSIDYFDNGVVSKDFIARDCSAYVKAWPELTMQLTGGIDVRESGNGEYTVSFGYDFDARNKSKGKTSRGHAADTWRVENRLGGYKIIYHRQTITNRSTR